MTPGKYISSDPILLGKIGPAIQAELRLHF